LSGTNVLCSFGAAAQPIVGKPDSYALRAEAAIAATYIAVNSAPIANRHQFRAQRQRF